MDRMDTDEVVETREETAPPPAPVCRDCGCTDALACAGGCYWVERDLCSQCAGQPEGWNPPRYDFLD